MKNSRAFTLLEMMVALVILSLIGTLSAIHIKKLIDVHRFENEVSHLFICLQEAQILSSVYQTDITLNIFWKKGELHYQFSSDEPFTTFQLDRTPKALPYVSAFQFKQNKIRNLQIDIFSGRIEPRGILRFSQADTEESKALWIDMQYGQLLKFSFRKPSLIKEQVPSKT